MVYEDSSVKQTHMERCKQWGKACVSGIIERSCRETSCTGEGRDDFSLLSSKQGALLRISKQEDRVNLPFNAAVLFLIRGFRLSARRSAESSNLHPARRGL